MRQRAAVVRAIRDYFDAQGFTEVDTPVALTAVAPEPHLEAPSVSLHLGHTTSHRFLQTSPELPMKRLVGSGLAPIYQIAPCFRDGDYSPQHRPEFRLLEWYRAPAHWTELLHDCEQLLLSAAAAVGAGEAIDYQNRSIRLTPPYPRISVEEAFLTHAGFSIRARETPQALAPQVRRLGLPTQPDDSWDDLFYRVFLSVVEPALVADGQPFFLTHYPAPLAALAQLDPSDPRVSERFELYVAGMELANGFGELTDANRQRQRFARDKALRQARGMAAYPEDEAFYAALEQMPPAAGSALGLERLLMLVLDVNEIDAVNFLPWSET